MLIWKLWTSSLHWYIICLCSESRNSFKIQHHTLEISLRAMFCSSKSSFCALFLHQSSHKHAPSMHIKQQRQTKQSWASIPCKLPNLRPRRPGKWSTLRPWWSSLVERTRMEGCALIWCKKSCKSVATKPHALSETCGASRSTRLLLEKGMKSSASQVLGAR